MNIHSFIGASSALLLAWLGATYLHEIPPERYPKQDRTSAATHKTPAEERITDLSSNNN